MRHIRLAKIYRVDYARTQIKRTVAADPSIKLIFICSPGNPTGTLIPTSVIRDLLEYDGFKGIVIVDEAYIDFTSEDASAASLITEYANLCVMQTLSKSFGLAAIRSVVYSIMSRCLPLIYATCSSDSASPSPNLP